MAAQMSRWAPAMASANKWWLRRRQQSDGTCYGHLRNKNNNKVWGKFADFVLGSGALQGTFSQTVSSRRPSCGMLSFSEQKIKLMKSLKCLWKRKPKMSFWHDGSTTCTMRKCWLWCKRGLTQTIKNHWLVHTKHHYIILNKLDHCYKEIHFLIMLWKGLARKNIQ